MTKKKNKRIKKVSYVGDITDFARHKNVQTTAKSNFKVISSGMSRTIEFDNGYKQRFFGIRGASSIIPGSYFVGMLKKSIDRYIAKKGIVAKQGKPMIQMFNVDAIKKVVDKPITCIDLNLCYWRTAFLLGFMDEDLYVKGMKSGHKRGMLVSIGALNKTKLIEHYEDGKLVSKSFDENYSSTYSPFYWAVLNKVNDLAMEIYKALKDDMYMWLTDCAFISTDRQKEVEGIIKKYGFNSKHYVSNFSYIDERNVEWFDCKHNKFKYMSISNRSLKEQYDKWKYQQKFYEKNTILQPKKSN